MSCGPLPLIAVGTGPEPEKEAAKPPIAAPNEEVDDPLRLLAADGEP